MKTITTNALFDKKKQFHSNNAHLPFEEKVKQIIELQKIDTEFNKHRNSSRESYKRIWDIELK